MHKLLYRQGLTLEQAIAAMDAVKAATPEAAQDVDFMQAFLATAANGITR